MSATYPSLAAAITALNATTAISGPVTITLTGNETAPAGGYSITSIPTGASAINNIVIQGSGSTITAFTPQASGTLNDAIFKIIGADFITIQNFTMQENAANTTTATATNNMTEFGVALFYASTTNGAQNNIIQNNIISLNRTYSNTFGIYSNVRHSATAVTTTADITLATGSNLGNKVYNNTLSNVNFGIVFIGSSTAAAIDNGNDIGGSSSGTSNTLTNWGGHVSGATSGYTSLTTSNVGIFMNQQINENVSFNSVTSATNITTLATTSFYGILKNYSVGQPTGVITASYNSNTVTLSNAPTTSQMCGISLQGITTALSTATFSCNNNNILNCAVTGASATTASMLGVFTTSAVGTLNITGNTIRGFTTTSTSGSFTGITQQTNAVVTALNINNNKIGDATAGAITFSNATSGTISGIVVSSTGAASTCALSITGNDFRGIVHNTVGTSAHTYISNAAVCLSQNISSNTFTNLNVNTTGSVTFISNNVALPTGGSVTASSNSIVTAFNKGGAGGTVTLYLTNTTPSSLVGTTKTEQSNNFSNITLTGATTMAGWMDMEGATGGGSTKTISNNTFSNWTCGTGAVNVIQTNYGGNNTSVSSNTISNISTTATSGGSITAISIGSSNGGTAQTCSSNNITGLSAGNLGSATGITGGSSSITTMTMNGNTINNLSSSNSSGTALGLSVTGGATVNVSSNVINTLSGTGTSTCVATGLSVTSGTTVNVFKNKIYDLLESGLSTSSPAVNGMLFSGGTTVTAYNNLIGDLRATTISSTEAIRGISITSATTSTTFNVYYNTVYLNATSTGTNFGTTGIFHTASSTSTTAALNLRNNIIVNNSTPAGTGLTVAYRRSSGIASMLANYSSTSNKNDFYAGTPGASNLIYTDGTSSAQTMALYKAGVFTAGTIAPRDAASISESPTFLSTAGSNSNFLHIDTSVPTNLESGGAPLAGITDDYDGNPRNVTTPDIGAVEFNGTIPILDPGSFSAATISTSEIDLSFTTTLGNNVVIVWNLTGTFTSPTGAPSIGGSLAGGTVLSNGTISPVQHTSLTQGGKYYYKAFSYNGTSYSVGLTANATSYDVPKIAVIGSPANGATAVSLSQTLNWTSGGGNPAATGYKIFFGTDNPPTNIENGTDLGNVLIYTPSSLTLGTTYYWRIAPYNGYGDQTGGTIWSFSTLGAPMSGTYDVSGLALFNKITGKNLTAKTFTRKVMKEMPIENTNLIDKTEDAKSLSKNITEDTKSSVKDLTNKKDNSIKSESNITEQSDNMNVSYIRKTILTEVDEEYSVIYDGDKVYKGSLFISREDIINLSKKSKNGIDGIMSPNSNGVYASVYAAVFDLNARGIGGATTFNLTGTTYSTTYGESFPIIINSVAGMSSSNTLTIKPDVTLSKKPTITGSATSALIKIYNSNYVTIDGSNTTGGTSRDLTITNTSATTPGVLWIGSNGTTPITNVTVKNCTLINGANTSTAVTISDGTTSGSAGYFNNITIQNNSIQKAYYGIYSIGTVLAGNGSGLLITGNDLNTTGANALGYSGIYVQGVDGATVSNNNIGNISTSSALSPKGIWFATGTNSGSISGNTISNITLTNTGVFYVAGIYVTPGATATSINVNSNNISNLINSGTSSNFAGISTTSPNTNITNNTVSSMTQNASIGFWGIVQNGAVNSNCSGNTVSGLTTATSGTSSGINIQGLSTGVNVFNNKVYNIKNTYSIGYGSNGIMLSSSSTSSNIKVYNNLIYDVASYGYASGYGVTDNGYGIILTTGGGYNIYYNSVSLSTDQTVAGNPACFNVVSGVTALDVRNNIFSNTQTVGTNRFAIISQALTTTYSNLDYNDYYTTGAIIGYYNSANVSNIAAWKSTLGKDLNSVSGNPGFSSATNLQIDVNNANCWNVNAGAMPLASVTTDFNGTARNTTVSSGACDIGAYEFTPVATPANLTILNSFTDGGTSTITFAGVNIATITWHLNGGTLPTSLTADFQPGVNPSNTIGGSSYANENLVVTVPDGSGYLYDIVLGYNLARQGTIGSESVFRLAKYSNSTWTQYPATPNTGNRTISVTGLNSFSTFTFGDGNAPLPVQLSSFSSSINGRDVKLNWKTDKETNNSGFDVERAEVGSQNLEYKKIGYVKGNGNTNSPVSYTFDDKKLNSGKYNYRLKQLDYNGNYTYHNLSTTIDVSLPTKFNLSQNYPNPFNPTTKIDFELPFDSKVNIALYDMTGREVKTLVNESRTAGYYTVQFNALDLSSGTYFYRIITKSADKDFVATKKMVLIK